MNLWASGSERVIDTAQYFSTVSSDSIGTTQPNCMSSRKQKTAAATLLDPGTTCIAYAQDETNGHDKGSHKLNEFRRSYLRAAAGRLESHFTTPGQGIADSIHR